MKIYRNYDGNKSTFGDVSVKTTSTSNPDSLSVFGAQRSWRQRGHRDGDQQGGGRCASDGEPVELRASRHRTGLPADQRQRHRPPVRHHGPASSVALTVPAQSVTLLVVPASGGPVNQAPTAVASATPTSGTAPLNVAFSAAGSSDADGSIASYQWAFGDGTTGSGPTPSKVYSSAGRFTAIAHRHRQPGRDRDGDRRHQRQRRPPRRRPRQPTSSASASSRTVTLRWTDASSNEGGFHVERAVKGKNPAFTRVGRSAPTSRRMSRR